MINKILELEEYDIGRNEVYQIYGNLFNHNFYTSNYYWCVWKKLNKLDINCR